MISFDSLAAYEAYCVRLKTDEEGVRDFALAETQQFILREERTFVPGVAHTLAQPALLQSALTQPAIKHQAVINNCNSRF